MNEKKNDYYSWVALNYSFWLFERTSSLPRFLLLHIRYPPIPLSVLFMVSHI